MRVVFRDDEFNPQHAVQVCREMVEQEGAFLLVGGGGADQITACAQYANENGIPYLSAGVNEEGLADLDTYFATTLTYAEQAPLIVAQLQEQGFTEAALVVADTPSFEDAYAGAARRRRRTPGSDDRLREPDQQGRLAGGVGHGGPAAEGLRRRGRRSCSRRRSCTSSGWRPAPTSQSYAPVWIGPGITSGLNAVTAIGCPERGDRRVLLADPGAGRHRRARSRLQPRVRPVRRGRHRRRHRVAAVVAQQGDRR